MVRARERLVLCVWCDRRWQLEPGEVDYNRNREYTFCVRSEVRAERRRGGRRRRQQERQKQQQQQQQEQEQAPMANGASPQQSDAPADQRRQERQREH